MKKTNSKPELTKDVITEIVDLHNGIIGYFKSTVANAIRIGQLLLEVKGKTKHGEFGEWISKNLPFTDRTARRYIKVYNNKNKLKTDTVSDLTGAYRLLSGPAKDKKKAVKSKHVQGLVEYSKDQEETEIHISENVLIAMRGTGIHTNNKKNQEKIERLIKYVHKALAENEDWKSALEEWINLICNLITADKKSKEHSKKKPPVKKTGKARHIKNSAFDSAAFELASGYEQTIEEYRDFKKQTSKKFSELEKLLAA